MREQVEFDVCHWWTTEENETNVSKATEQLLDDVLWSHDDDEQQWQRVPRSFHCSKDSMESADHWQERKNFRHSRWKKKREKDVSSLVRWSEKNQIDDRRTCIADVLRTDCDTIYWTWYFITIRTSRARKKNHLQSVENRFPVWLNEIHRWEGNATRVH